jgi:hypothetical protein
MKNIRINLNGPYSWLENTEVLWIGDMPENDKGGIYLWTVKHDDYYLVNYVGQANTFGNRLNEHLLAFRNGEYWVYKADKFARGIKEKIYDSVNYTQDDFKKVKKELEKMLGHILIFVAAVDVDDKRLRERIESSLYYHLKKEGHEDFLDNDEKKLHGKGEKEEGLTVNVKCKRIPGLPASLTV